ncbi:hypothetical protein, partial [Sphingomonas segetis]|uniref:hypothetical protein n=1 Tax=Sphingomonas segetis TaxID=1104779 RepID=UPI001E6146A9
GPAHCTPATGSSLCTPVRYRRRRLRGRGRGPRAPDPQRVRRRRAETVAVQLVPVGATRRIDAPEPNNCNF